jgi:hypothetical protein
MWLSDKVEISDRILDAHLAGKLVIFVGAGASVGVPSSLPDFAKLTERICYAHGTSIVAEGYPDRSDEFPYDIPYDLILDRLSAKGMIKESAKSILDDPSSCFTELHKQIIRLSFSGPEPKIVTTNYDSHLTKAAEALGLKPEVFHAPALPLGRSFEGIVHAHGSLEREPQLLVLTRTDFGHAYLTDGWATRFLYTMFEEFTVLFIGYSHRDLIVDYLARGLSNKGERFAFTSEKNLGRWHELKITPIQYELDHQSDHSHLVEAISNWADLRASGASERRMRIKAIAENPPSLGRSEESLIAWAITDPVSVDFVCEFARGPEWLDWLMKQIVFSVLFKPGFREDDSQPLARWFAQQCVIDPTVSTHALRAIVLEGGSIGTVLWFSIIRELGTVEGKLAPHRDRWITWLIETAPPHSDRELVYLLLGRTFGTGPETTLQLWSHLTTPHLEMQPSYVQYDQNVSPDVAAIISFSLETWAFESFWAQAAPTLSVEVVWSVLEIAKNNLTYAHRLYGSFHESRYVPIGFEAIYRPTIEQNSQNLARDAGDILIDSARDALCFALRANPSRANTIIDHWLNSDVSLIRRIAWYCMGSCSTQKADWIIKKMLKLEVLHDSFLKHEIFHILRKHLPDASVETQNLLFGSVAAFKDDEPDSAYRKFNLLVWLEGTLPYSSQIQDQLDGVRQRYPDFARREHPDLNSWFSMGTVGNNSVLSPDELLRKSNENPAKIIEELLRLQERVSPFDRPSWQDVQSTIFEGVRTHPQNWLQYLACPQFARLDHKST